MNLLFLTHIMTLSRTPGPIPHSDDYWTEIFHPQSYEQS